jgi:flagellin
MSKLEDLKGDSTTYFDGMSGAIPIGIDMLNNETSVRKSELKSTLEKVAELNSTFENKAKHIISNEITKTQEVSPFKSIDFGKESVDFTGANISTIVGSIASSQANAMQAQSIKLLS